MRLAFPCLLFSTFFVLPACAQRDTLHWRSSLLITWADYRGSTARLGFNTTNEAATNSGIRIDFRGSNNNTWRLNIYAIFNCGLSCTRSDSSTYLLNHEANHFNITELITRRLRKELENSTFIASNAQAKITTIYNKYIAELNMLQNKYDADTQHSMNRERQAAWDAWIKNELDVYADYANQVVFVRVGA